MNHTLFAEPLFGARPSKIGTFGASFQGFCRWLVDGTAIGLKPMQQTCLRQSLPAPKGALALPTAQPAPLLQPAARQGQSRRGTIPLRAVRAVRVVRVQESGQPRASVGRMVISGRMEDVCAELDRLVAQEATLH